MTKNIFSTLALIILAHTLFIINVLANDPFVKLPKSSTPPVIDGILEESIWSQALEVTDFKTIQPDYGNSPSEKTKAFLSYDDNNFYLGIFCYDSNPEQIKATLTARDKIVGDDWVAFCIDSDNDEMNSYFFLANPYGIQVDGILDAQAEPDLRQDMVWESAGKINEDGYVVEMAIPIKNLRFQNSQFVKMGFKLARFISRKSEEVDFPEFHPENGAALAQFQKIKVQSVKSGNLNEWIPEISYSHQSSRNENNSWNSLAKPKIGLNGKMSLSSGLTLDATINPDFSQIETDASQIEVNLRSSILYPEKRPFFLEGQEWFGFSARPSGTYLQEIINTRNIVDPIAGVKFSGKLDKKNILSTLYAIDEYSENENNTEGNSQYSILRYGRKLSGDSYLGAVYTGWKQHDHSNSLAGLDGRIRLNNKWSWEYHGFLSSLNDSSQNTNAHAIGTTLYFQTREWGFRIGSFDLAKGFNTKVGYVARNGIFSLPLFVIHHWYFEHKAVQRMSFFIWSRQNKDHFENLWETYNIAGLELGLPKQTQISISSRLGNEIYAGQIFSRNSIRFEFESYLLNWFSIETELNYGKGIYYHSENPLQGKGTEIGIQFKLQVSSKLSTQFNLNYADLYTTENSDKLYAVSIFRNTTIFQFSKFIFLRGIVEYNNYEENLEANFLLSYSLKPGTVVYVGYGSSFRREETAQYRDVDSNVLFNTRRAWFLKASYRL